MQEYVFRFMSGRPADLAKKLERKPWKLNLYEGIAKASPFHEAVERVKTIDDALRLVAELRESSEHVRSTAELPFPVTPGLDWALENQKLVASEARVREGVEAVYATTAASLASDERLQEALMRLADTILAQTIVADTNSVELDSFTLGYKLLTFLLGVANGAAFPSGATVADMVGRRTLIIPAIGKLEPRREESPPATNELAPASGATEQERASLLGRLSDLEQARSELSRFTTDASAVTLHPVSEGSSDRMSGLESQLSDLRATLARVSVEREEREQPLSGGAFATSGDAKRLVLTPAAVGSLSPASVRALEAVHIDPTTSAPLTAVGTIEDRIAEIAARVPANVSPSRTILIAGAQLDEQRLREAYAPETNVRGVIPVQHFCNFEAGIGDLLMVRQTLKAYELVDFSHVENVLAGETRSREHRLLDSSETITSTEEVNETQKETDLQSTQRNEMQTEADKVVKQQFGLEAGVQVSGSYGPSISFSSHLNANYSTASEETQRKSVSFSQEVTEKASQNTRQMIKQNVTHRVLQEIQEINNHAFVNTSSEHDIRGVYRWLDKIYDAQIYNYGQRMLYEFVVPEPAAYFLYAMVEDPPQEDTLVKPEPPMFEGAPLQPGNLTRANYGEYVAQYGVTGVPAPPTEFQVAAYFDKQDGKSSESYGRAGKIDIPEGYSAYAAVVQWDYTDEEGANSGFHLMLGDTSFDFATTGSVVYRNIEPRQREMSVAYVMLELHSWALGIDVLCKLTSAGEAKWRESVFDSITEAYLQQKSDYEQALAAKAVQSGPGQLGRNPAENLRIAKEEIKKLVLMILTGSDSIEKDSYLFTSEPLMDLAEVCPNGSWIRFFEDAFEWTNMLYVLYPYFWGRSSRWSAAIHFTDPDPEFEAFLRAGAARVQIPVRPGFEAAVAYFCQFGEIWQGSEPPLREDEMYVPIIDEIAASLGKYEGEGVPYPEGSQPWEVNVPTELVLLEDISEVPNIRDVLTGNNVTLGS